MITLTVISACSDEFLNEVPRDQIDLENFFTKPVDAEIGLIGGYAKIISKHTMNNLFWLMVSADELTSANHANSGIGSGDHRENTTSDLWGMLGTYTVPYTGIVNMNVLLQKVPNIPDSQFAGTRKNEILGEAYFLRGYAYYMFAMVFRDVPLQIEVPTSSNPEDNYMNSSPNPRSLTRPCPISRRPSGLCRTALPICQIMMCADGEVNGPQWHLKPGSICGGVNGQMHTLHARPS